MAIRDKDSILNDFPLAEGDLEDEKRKLSLEVLVDIRDMLVGISKSLSFMCGNEPWIVKED